MARLPTDVRIFRHTDPGAPELKGAPGSMVELLNACLVSGYGSTTVTSVTREGATVTVTIQGGHSFPKYAVAQIDGANESDYNGIHRIETVTDTTLTFTLPDGVTPATPATGTITVKMAGAGWAQPYASADNLRRVFRSADPESFGYYLYVDDTEATYSNRAAAKGYGIVEDIDTRSNPFPWSATDDQWVWWPKGWDDTTARPWAVIADSRLFYVWVDANSSSNPYIYAFGDILTHNSADVHACVVAGHGSGTDSNYCGGLLTVSNVNNPPPGGYLAMDLYGSAYGMQCSSVGADVRTSAPDDSYDIYPHALGISDLQFPCPITSAVLLSKPFLVEYIPNGKPVIRGTLPGLYEPLHNEPFSSLEIVMAAIQTQNPLMALKYLASRGTFYYERGPREGQVLIDVVGPWRY